MNRGPFIALSASAILAAALLVGLFKCTGLDLAQAGRLILGLGPVAFAEIVLLIGFHSFLAGEKWRLADHYLGNPGCRNMPRSMYFALTAIGVGLGQILPTQITLAVCRSLGSHGYGGSAVLRGTAATLFEQLFDVFIAVLLGLASILVIVTAGDAPSWFLWMMGMSIAGFVLANLATRFVARIFLWMAPRSARMGMNRLNSVLVSAGDWAPFAARIGRSLFALSLLRFVVLVMVGVASAAAVPLDIPVWHLAAAIPFAILANALALTPGGLGVNEWTISSALFAFGTSLQVSAQWAVVNRVLVVLAAVAWSVAGIAVAVVVRWCRTAPSV